MATTLTTTGSSVSAGTSNQSATVTVQTYSHTSSAVQLVIPSIGIDSTIVLGSNWSPNAADYDSGGTLYIGGLSYASFGYWVTRTPDSYSGTAAFAFGYETPLSAVPATGRAKYTGVGTVNGLLLFSTESEKPAWTWVQGDAELSADFVSGKITGQFSNMTVAIEDILPWNDISITAGIASGTNRFSGTTAVLTTPDSPRVMKPSATGFIDGAFYGPNADNIGAIWSLSDGVGSAIGTVGAQRNP